MGALSHFCTSICILPGAFGSHRNSCCGEGATCATLLGCAVVRTFRSAHHYFFLSARSTKGGCNHLSSTAVAPRARKSFSRLKHVLDLPNLIDIQKASFEWFKNEGLRDTIADL